MRSAIFTTNPPAAIRAAAFALISPNPAVSIPSDILESPAAHRSRVRVGLLDLATALEAEPGPVTLAFGKRGLAMVVTRDVLLLAGATFC